MESALNSENCIDMDIQRKIRMEHTALKAFVRQYYEKKTAAVSSSAITINGKSTTLDMSGLERLLLAGKNYIAS